jgi:hypothetical protein
VGSAVDCHDRRLPRNGCCDFPAQFSLGLLALGESPRGHEFYHHSAVLELVFDEVHMVKTGRFVKFLKMVLHLSCLALEIALGGRDILLVRVIHFLFIIIAAGGDYGLLRASLFPILATLSTFLSSFAGGFG